MRVLVISYNFPPKTGGLESVVFNVWSALKQRHSVHAIVPHAKEYTKQYSQVYRCPLGGLPFFFVYALLSGFWLLLKNDFDVIYSGSALTSPLAVILGKIFRKKVASSIHGLDIIYPNPIYRNVILPFLPKNDAVIANSRSTREKAVAAGVLDEKISIIHPGLSYQMFQAGSTQEELKHKYGLSGRQVVLSAGRLAKRKGILEFIENSLPGIISEVPETTLVVVGENPKESLVHKEDMAGLINQKVRQLNLDRHVEMVGRVDDETLVEYYRLCDLFIMPVIPVAGDSEGFGMVAIEAGASGKPVVGSQIGGIPDAVEDGRSGILIQPGDYRTMTEQVIRFLTDADLRERFGQYAKRRARENFDWTVIGNSYCELLQDLNRS